ncbi:hypothetical protein IKP85_05465 [bacterium]|nr:hypothetical protein [bacterium]
MNKNSNKILVHLHLFYHNQIDYFISKLSNIDGCDWDLYVTVCEENKASTKKLLKLKPDVKIVKVENIGYDIYPFIQVCRMVNLDDYDYVLKIHTKNYRKVEHKFKEANVTVVKYSWRNDLVNVLIGSKNIFKENLKILSKKNAGIILSKKFLFPLRDRIEDTYLLENLKIELNLKSSYKYYCAGTMFIIRSELLKTLVNSNISERNFIVKEQHTEDNGKFVHAVERIFTILVNNEGYNIYVREVDDRNKLKIFLQNIFSIKNENHHIVITIIGIKLKFKSKKRTNKK